ncbi:Rne/Rng family ribonuclease [Aeromicrobium sp. IC_218]|uniref:Rne/Rng family ribonuclease n=1 Tax=Aeromicrobium sp. IC_218 TaxID=2545468 RepID=UPI0026A11786
MLDDNDIQADGTEQEKKGTSRRAAGRPAGPPAALFSAAEAPAAPKAARRPARKKAAEPAAEATETEVVAPADEAPAKKAPAKRTRKAPAKKAAEGSADQPTLEGTGPQDDAVTEPVDAADSSLPQDETTDEDDATEIAEPASTVPAFSAGVLFQPPPAAAAPPRRKPAPVEEVEDEDDAADEQPSDESTTDATDDEATADAQDSAEGDDDREDGAPRRRRRSRGGRRRRRSSDEDSDESDDESGDDESTDDADDESAESEGGSSSSSTRRRRKRSRSGGSSNASSDDPEDTVVKVREGRSDEITAVTGSTRLEAKKQRRREGREAGRRRAPIVSEAEFLARREAVKREMVVRQRQDFTQIAVLEDDVLVEHYVARESQTSLIGNVYLGRVQNVLPSMEAAFVDIGKGRNAVLYAGEVDWSALGNGKPRKIEEVLEPGQTVLVQVSKDPVGQKGARLTSQVSLPGRFLVYVPGGHTSGISRKLPDTERARLKALLKEVLPAEAGVIVRTAAEGATEDQLTRDVQALTARWSDIEAKVADGKAPQLLYAEPDLTIKVVRDLFNEDFSKLVVEGDDAWDMLSAYVEHVAPDLADRIERWDDAERDAFSAHRIDEQIAKALDRKVHLPSGGSLIIDRTEAMTVVDVNTGKFTGSGGNLEETVTRNNLEAAEEIVRQLRLRDIGGIVVVDFIDMVLESNRDLVLRRMVECLGRDRTRHQVAEVTSLGLVQMTRKRIGTGLVEAFSTECEHCKGRGLMIHEHPVEPKNGDDGGNRRGRRGRGRKGGDEPRKDESASEKQVYDETRTYQGPRLKLHDEDQPADEAEETTEAPVEAEAAPEAAEAASAADQPQDAPEVVVPPVPAERQPEPVEEPAQAEPVEVESAPVEEPEQPQAAPAVEDAQPEPASEPATDEPVRTGPVVSAPVRSTSRPRRRSSSRSAGAPKPITLPETVTDPVLTDEGTDQ